MITVGFTYDLRDDYIAQGFSAEDSAEFDSRETIAFIENALQTNDYVVERIGNIKALAGALASGKRWDIVFNICEGVKGIGREAQVPALLEAYNIPFVFSSSDVMVLTMDKALAKMVVRERGVPTAPFAVVRDESDIALIDLPFPLFAKPLAEGTSKGIHATSHVQTAKNLRKVCLDLLEQFSQPVLVESYLPGEEFTVCFLGTGRQARIIAIGEILTKPGGDTQAYTYRNKVDCFDDIALYEGSLTQTIRKTALQAWVALGCRDCGRIDIRLSKEGIPNFMEVNPLPGLRPDYSELPILAALNGMDHTTLIGNIMDEALRRYDL